MNNISIWVGNSHIPDFLKDISNIYCIPFANNKKQMGLVWKDNKLMLSCHEFPKDIFFDFEMYWKYHQKQNYSLKKEPLAKALRLKDKKKPFIWDISCGTGKDSILLLSFGMKVKAFERSKIIGVLLLDALRRVQDPYLVDVLEEHFSLEIADPRYFPEEQKPDIIYFDPMYPEKKKTSLPRKEMRVLRKLVGNDDDAKDVFLWARGKALKKVIVKRPIHAPAIIENPLHSFKGKSTRYDMWC